MQLQILHKNIIYLVRKNIKKLQLVNWTKLLQQKAMDQNTPNADIENLFKYFDRYLMTRDNFLSIFILTFYFPIGILLIIIRSFLLLVLNLITFISPNLKQNGYFIRYVCITFGIHTRFQSGKTQINDEPTDSPCLFVSNHVTCLDYCSLKSIVHKLNYFEDLSNRCLTYKQNNSLIDLISNFYTKILQTNVPKNLQEDFYISKSSYPLLKFPELMSTNGRAALLKFDPQIFEICPNNAKLAIYPACLQVTRPLLPLSVNYIHSNDFLNLILVLFSPITIYNVNLLDKQFKQEKETSEEFSERVRAMIGSRLNLELSQYNHDDLRKTWSEYKRRVLVEEQRNAELRSSSLNQNTIQVSFSDISKLALQIREILPDVSYDVIQQHIRASSSLDIDTVIASILDDTRASPEFESVSPSFSRSQSSPSNFNTSPKPVLNTSKSVIDNKKLSNSNKSYKSYEERKFELLNEARKRYLAKNSNF